MATMIDSSSVLRLFENNLFDYDDERQLLVYHENGLNMEFAVPWFTNEVGKTYDLAHVRGFLGELMKNVKHTEDTRKLMSDPEFMKNLSKEMTDFGMVSVEGMDNVFGYMENGKGLFTVELEYIVSLLVINKNETVTSLLSAMRDDVRGEYGQKEENRN